MKNLIIAEKPSVAKDIAKALGAQQASKDHHESGELIISSAVGHIAGLTVTEAEDKSPLPIIPKNFQIAALDGCRERLHMLEKLIKRSDTSQIINCCDAGREGELIFCFLYEYIGIKKPVKRMWLQSMTEDAIVTAYRSMKEGKQYQPLLDAARCRAESDWLVGINGSRALGRLTRKMTGTSGKVSVGRVQTPTLAVVVHRDLRIRDFVPEDYWEVTGTFEVEAGTYGGKWERQGGGDDPHRLSSPKEMGELIERCKGRHPDEVSDETKEQVTKPPKLFDLTTLQRVANAKYGFAAKKTLDVAQSLYEKHKVLSYPRTDSQALPEDYLGKVVEIMGNLNEPFDQFAEEIKQNNWVKAEKRIFDNSKISDHFAIIPTGASSEQLNYDEAAIYELVVRRFLAAFYPAARHSITKRTTVVAGERFVSSGRVLIDPGWQIVNKEISDDSEEAKVPQLVALRSGESAKATNYEGRALKTKPPGHFTEATLLAAMEGAAAGVENDEAKKALKGKGLGTPATRAATIEGLKAKGYIASEGKKILSTETGVNLIGFLEKNNLELLVSAEMTGEWEWKLEQMAAGKYERSRFMSEIGQLTVRVVDIFKEQESKVVPAEGTTATCPDCGTTMFRRASKFKAGEHYWACSGFPECKMTLPDVDGKPGEKKKAEAAAPIDKSQTIPCEKCGKAMVRRLSKFKEGEYYWTCTGFPKCKATKPGGQATVPTELKLPTEFR